MTDLITVLTDKGIEFKYTNNPAEIVIRCTSGLHEDANPSMSYNLEKNVFHCFSCDFQGGIMKFLQSIGITQKLHIESKQEYKILKLKRMLSKIANVDNLRLPAAINPINWDFRQISTKTLKEFNAFTTSEYEFDEYVCIPVYLFGRLKFIDGRLRHSDYSMKSKYTRKPAGISVKDVLFPIDKIDKVNHIILVEGMYDMLKLWEHNIRNCLCIFGTQNFAKEKVELLDKIGVSKVTILMDGDRAGQTAANRIESLLERNDILTYKIQLGEDQDPGNLSKEYLYSLLERIK